MQSARAWTPRKRSELPAHIPTMSSISISAMAVFAPPPTVTTLAWRLSSSLHRNNVPSITRFGWIFSRPMTSLRAARVLVGESMMPMLPCARGPRHVRPAAALPAARLSRSCAGDRSCIHFHVALLSIWRAQDPEVRRGGRCCAVRSVLSRRDDHARRRSSAGTHPQLS